MQSDHWDYLFEDEPVAGDTQREVDRWRSTITGGTVEYDYPYASLTTVRDVRVTRPWKGPSRQGQRPAPVRVSNPRKETENERKRRLYAENPEYAERQREKNRRNRRLAKEKAA